MTRYGWCLLGVVGGLWLWASGCNGPTADYKPVGQLPAHDDHGHAEEGPHHGTLVELGDHEYHAEIVVDGKAHALKVFLLGKDAKAAAKTAAEDLKIALEGGATLTLKPAADQTAGEHAVFELVDEKVVHDLADAGFIHGQLQVRIGDKPYSVGLDIHFHEEHDHDHKEAPAAGETPKPAEAAAPAEAADAPK